MILRLLLFVLLVAASASTFAQFNQLILRKNGKAFKRFKEGSAITIETKLGMKYTGTIALLQNDSVYFDVSGIPVQDIKAVLKKKSRTPLIPMEPEAFLWANIGIPLFTAGLVISGQSFWSSFSTGVGLVYLPILFYHLKNFIFGGGAYYRIGSKYDLQLLDLYRAEPVPVQQQ
jgi:hypothetical protein